MVSGSFDLTTYYAKRIIGDNAATTYSTALLQAGVNASMWIFGHNRSNYGIKYLYDSTTNGTADKIEFYGGSNTATASIQLDDGTITAGDWNGHTIDVAHGGTGTTSFTSGELLTGNGSNAISTTGIYTLGTKGDAGWSTTTNRTKIPNMSFIAYWDGSYNGTSSNLSKLGTITSGTWNATTIGVAYGGTGVTSIADIQAGRDGDGNTISSTYLKLSGGTLTGNLQINKNTDVAPDGETGSLVIGSGTGANIGLDVNEIMARNNKTTATLSINGASSTDSSHLATVNIGNASDSYAQLYVRYATASSSKTTGALHVKGGAGIEGDVYANAFYGPLTGNVTGNLTGTVTGHATLDLPLTGGTLTNDLYIQNTDIDITNAANNVSTSKNRQLQFVDTNGRYFARIYGRADNDGSCNLFLHAGNYSSSEQKGRGMSITLDKSNNVTYTISDKLAFRNAIDAPKNDGTGASGTWGISISGNASTATAAATAAVATSATTATTASKLGSNAGGAVSPVYFSGGVPVACTLAASGAYWSCVPIITNNGVMEVGKYIDFHTTNTGTSDYDVRITAETSGLTISNGLTTGDTLKIQISGVDITNAANNVSSNTNKQLWFVDDNNRFVARIYGRADTNGNCNLILHAGNYYSGSQRYGGMSISLDKSGNVTYNVTDDAAFRSAINAPKTDGTDASGTWGISISGNATTATTASKLGSNAGGAAAPIYFSGGVPVACSSPVSGAWWSSIPNISSAGVVEIGKYVDFHLTNDATTDYDTRLEADANGVILYGASSGNIKNLVLKDLVRSIKTSNNGSNSTRNQTIYFTDKNNDELVRLLSQSHNNGSTALYLQVRNGNSDGSGLNDWEGIIIRQAKDGTMSYTVSSPSAFRTAIGAIEIGNTATTAMAGNTVVNQVTQGKSSSANWRKIVLGGSTYSAFDTATSGSSDARVYHADAVSVQASTGSIKATKVYNAVWNDYAEYRQAETEEPGYCVTETNNGIMIKTSSRLQPGCKIISDTFGTCMGETTNAKTPIAVAGRVLAYPYRAREEYTLGAAVCSAPNGMIDIMTRDEIMMYPERIVGTVSEIPNYEIWHGGNQNGQNDILVNGRIWIYVR